MFWFILVVFFLFLFEFVCNCRLLVNLTNPVLLLYREEVPTERTARHNYLQILLHLQSYKEEAFTKVDTWNVFAKKLAKVLEIVSLYLHNLIFYL